ncbi:hypothetical protein [Mesorhizobium sp. B1-1-5]|uniref:hypothetical protein n=1 Tax=Mesorhizobium sp. B1-1-5 TaxID=2589979 RepID=UPI0011288AD1|nr:hypothetical protein [Mesorhizobium sp. B1-1-5]TPO02189.1 hypothetical protein FJ980_18710 [Mesorhizobium sp. B1-1-5]
MLTAFDLAVAIWRDHDTGPDQDVLPGSAPAIATELQVEIMHEAARIPSKNAADVAAKEKIADHMERALDGVLTKDGEPITAALRRSIVADLMRFGRIVLFEAHAAA